MAILGEELFEISCLYRDCGGLEEIACHARAFHTRGGVELRPQILAGLGDDFLPSPYLFPIPCGLHMENQGGLYLIQTH